MGQRRATYVAGLGRHSLFPRDWQLPAFDWVDRRELEGRGGLLVGGCGAGKTEMAISACILHPVDRTLWVTKACLEDQTGDRIIKYLSRAQESRVVLLRDYLPMAAITMLDTMEPGSIVVVSFSQLPKFQDCLVNCYFDRIIVCESTPG